MPKVEEMTVIEWCRGKKEGGAGSFNEMLQLKEQFLYCKEQWKLA